MLCLICSSYTLRFKRNAPLCESTPSTTEATVLSVESSIAMMHQPTLFVFPTFVAGGRETLIERLRDHMMSSGDRTLFSEGAIYSGAGLETAASKQDDDVSQTDTTSQLSSGDQSEALKNNYHRPEGQNVGNFITDRPSSRVLAPPGGGTSISIG